MGDACSAHVACNCWLWCCSAFVFVYGITCSSSFLLVSWSGISVPAPVLGVPSQIFHVRMARFMSNFVLLFGCGASAALSNCSLCAQLTFTLHHEIARMWLLLYPICVCRRGIMTRSPA